MYHATIEGKNISEEEAKVLYYLMKSEKLKGVDITLQDIMNTFPMRTRKDIESMMRCVGLNINIGNLSIRSKNQCSQILALNDYLETSLTLHDLSMFRKAVGNKSISFNTKNVAVIWAVCQNHGIWWHKVMVTSFLL